MYEFLKALFGTAGDGTPEALTFEQLSAKLSENKELKLINLADGGYVSKDKFDAKEIEVGGLKKQLEEANSEIQSYKEMDIEGIKKAAADWEEKYNKDTAALNQQIKDQERSHMEDNFLNGYQFTSKAARAGIKALFDEKKFTLDNGVFLGAKEFMETLKEDADYKEAFVTAAPDPAPSDPDPAPTDPKPRFSQSQPQTVPPKKTRLTLSELMAKKNENPNYEVKYD